LARSGNIQEAGSKRSILAEAFTTVTDGYVMTSILNINESEIEIE
jgi:hypothetical protein